MPSTVTLRDDERVLFAGDSTSNTTPAVTAWYDGGFVASVNAQFVPVAKTYTATNSGTRASVSGTMATNAGVAPSGTITVLNGGVNGDTVAGLDARISALMASTLPQCVFIAIGTNDVAGGTDPNAFATSYTSVLNKIKAAYAGVDIVSLSIFVRCEAWDVGPVWADGGFPAGTQAAVAAINAKIQSCAAAAGAVYIDTHSQYLAWEVANNPSKLSTGIATTDGIHPNATGKTQDGNFVLPSCVVVP